MCHFLLKSLKWNTFPYAIMVWSELYYWDHFIDTTAGIYPYGNQGDPVIDSYYLYGGIYRNITNKLDFPNGSDGKASAYNAGDLGSIPG